jgi:amphi-Trp domain-containing protein
MADEPDDADRPDESETGEAAIFELERAYDRADLAAVFREFATAFESGRSLRLDGDERSVDIAVPQRVVAAFETERESNVEPPIAELELEIEWDDPNDSSLRITDRDARDTAEGRDRPAAADADPGTAVMPLEGVADRDGASSEDGDAEGATATAETDVTAETDMTSETNATTEGAGPAEETVATDRTGSSERTSRFEIYEDKAGQWRWRLVHWNGNIVADSGEGYFSRSNAERAARSVMRSAPSATIQRRD